MLQYEITAAVLHKESLQIIENRLFSQRNFLRNQPVVVHYYPFLWLKEKIRTPGLAGGLLRP